MKKRILFPLTVSLSGFVLLTAVLAFSFFASHRERILPNIFITNVNLGNLTKKQAEKALKKKLAAFPFRTLTLFDEEKKFEFKPEDIDLEYDLLKTIEFAFNFGRENIFSSLKLLFTRQNFGFIINLDEEKLDEKIKSIANSVNLAEQNGNLVFKNNKTEIIPEKNGRKLNEEKTKILIRRAFGSLNFTATVLPIEITYPKIKKEGAQKFIPRFEELVKQKIVFKYKNQTFTPLQGQIASWVDLGIKNRNIVYLKFNEEQAKKYLEGISREIDQPAQNARLKIADSRAVVFQPSREGIVLDQQRTLALLSELFSENHAAQTTTIEIKLPIITQKPEVTTENINNLGIKELVGSGATSFAKSPSNRIHNINVGANLFNGVLIKPGETFSFLKVLGKVSAEKGFLPELVIKEDATKPEIGGGLCQVSTTMFRAAVNSGLEIIERTNHKYRVSYYEPPVGLDATVYDPSPDLKFKNDTGNWLLIQAGVSGTKLTFDFYGTKDGREVHISEPKVYNFVEPEPAQSIETDTLYTDEQKYLEKAHTGADATVYYKVMRNGQELHKKTFQSHYVPWRAKILVGTKPRETEQPAPAAPTDASATTTITPPSETTIATSTTAP